MNQDELDRKAALMIIEYYLNESLRATKHGKNLGPYKPDNDLIRYMGVYLASTCSSELRYALRYAPRIDSRGLRAVEVIARLGVDARSERLETVESAIPFFIDWMFNNGRLGMWDTCGFIADAAMAFATPWQGSNSIGGKSWAYCAWAAGNWLGEMLSRGWVDNLLWEIMLNAVHNNSRWMNKVNGGYCVFKALAAGQNGDTADLYRAYEQIKKGSTKFPKFPVGSGGNDWEKAVSRIPALMEIDEVTNIYFIGPCKYCGSSDECDCQDLCDGCGEINAECTCHICSVCDEKQHNCSCPICPNCAGNIFQCDCGVVCKHCLLINPHNIYGIKSWAGYCNCAKKKVPRNWSAITFRANPGCFSFDHYLTPTEGIDDICRGTWGSIPGDN